MFKAVVGGQPDILPARGLVGTCPACGEEVTPKCGDIVTWHWAHRPESACSGPSEETEWHRFWKSCAEPQFREFSLTMGGQTRRCDVYRYESHAAWEIQYSSIKTEEALARCKFWGNIRWLFYAADKGYKPEWNTTYDNWNIHGLPWPLLYKVNGKIYLDLGSDKIFSVKRVNEEGSWMAGDLINYDDLAGFLAGGNENKINTPSAGLVPDGVCELCGGPMMIFEEGQTTHPGCDLS